MKGGSYGCEILVEAEIWRGVRRGKLFTREMKTYDICADDIAAAISEMAASVAADIKNFDEGMKNEEH